MIRAVIWDFGGVLSSSPFENFRRYERDRGLPTDYIRRINSRNPDDNAWARFERDEIDLDAFNTLFREESAALGHAIDGRDVVALLGGEIRAEMVTALRRCSARYLTACVTNNIKGSSGFAVYAGENRGDAVHEILALFRVVIESSVVGLRKPDPRIYRMVCEKLGVEPTEAVYLDDLGINLKPARQLGMTTIKVVDPGAALAELEAVLDLRLR